MTEIICKTCGNDHKQPNIGPLTVCEREAYIAHGGAIGVVKNEKVRGFGIGQNRFQIGDKV